MEEINELIQIRREKVNKLTELGAIPFAYSYEATDFSADIIEKFEEESESVVKVAGRIMSHRLMGKAAFFHLQDKKGKIQIYIRQDKVGEKPFQIFKILDIGDFVGIEGPVFKTRTGEISVLAEKFEHLSKSIRPLPIVKEKIEDNEKVIFDQFADKEARYRQRYVDLVVNPEVKDVFINRSRIISSIRGYLDKAEFLEVETPILQPVYGGATARPFITHHNKLDMDLYLRIANELYLKRLIVGGIDRVYEFSKDFRNEGMDRFHNPEFTQIELYAAYKDYIWMMEFVEQLINHVVLEVFGTTKFTFLDHQIDFKMPWKRLTMMEAIKEHIGIDVSNMDENGLRETVKDLGLEEDSSMGHGKLIDEIFGEKVEPNLIQPTYIMDYPIEMSPLAKKHRNNPNLVERFEAVVGGKEVANAFSELNDPIDQRERFEEQLALKEKGDDEAQVMDEDYIRALEYGMPPTAGLGIGIDRLVMLLTNSPSIRDVIFFPQMRPETGRES